MRVCYEHGAEGNPNPTWKWDSPLSTSQAPPPFSRVWFKNTSSSQTDILRIQPPEPVRRTWEELAFRLVVWRLDQSAPGTTNPHSLNQTHQQPITHSGLRSTQLRGIAAQRELEKHFYTTYLSPKEMFYSTQDGSYGNAVRRHAKPHTEYNKVNTSSSSAQDQNLKHILERFMQPLGPCQSHQMIVTMKLNKT